MDRIPAAALILSILSIVSSRYENGFVPSPFVGMGLSFALRWAADGLCGKGRGKVARHIGKARQNGSDGL